MSLVIKGGHCIILIISLQGGYNRGVLNECAAGCFFGGVNL